MANDPLSNPKYDPVKQLLPVALLDASVIRSLLTALVVLAGTIGTIFFGIDEKEFNEKGEKIIAALVSFLVVAAPIGVAIWARLHKPTPPVETTRAAADAKTTQMQQAGILPPEVKS